MSKKAKAKTKVKSKTSKTKTRKAASKAKTGRTSAKTASSTKRKSATKTKARTKTKSRSKSKSRTKVLAIPKGYTSITPYLIIKNAEKAIQFYKDVFGAKEAMRMKGADGKIVHAELIIGDSKFMLADVNAEMNAKSPESFGGTPVGIHLYVKDVDSIIKKAQNAGAKLERPPTDMFYGDRIASITDPFGHKWSVATHIEDVTPKEMQKRMAAFTQAKTQTQPETHTPSSTTSQYPQQQAHQQQQLRADQQRSQSQQYQNQQHQPQPHQSYPQKKNY